MDDMYEIVSGALDVAPVQYGIFTINDIEANYYTQEVVSIEGDEDFFKTASYNRFLSQMTEFFDEDTAKSLATYVAQINADYFGGCINENVEKYKNDKLYTALKEKGEAASFLINYLNVMLSETTTHKNLQFTID